MSSQPDPTWAPTPSQLAAYVDGELEAGERLRVEDWLAENPQAEEEVDAHLRLLTLWQSAQPAEPTEAKWAVVRSNIQAGLAAHPMRSAFRGRDAWLRWLAALTAAGVIWIFLGLGGRDNPPGPFEQEENEQPFPVASAEDVDIISVQAADARSLVVGEPPLAGPLVLGAPGDVKMRNIEPDVDGMVPKVRMTTEEGPAPPMIVAPLAREADPP